MKHIEIDEIYKYKLGLFESERETEIRNHINNCELCREKLDSIENEINILSSFNPPLVKAHNPLKIEKSNLIWLKRAAVILIGMLITYSAIDNFVYSKQIVVTGQKFIPQNSSIDSLELFNSHNVDLYTDF